MGIDVGRENTGVVTYDIANGEVCRNATIQLQLRDMRLTRSFNPQYYRLDLMASMLNELVKQDEPILSVIEDYIYGDRAATVEDLRGMDRDPLKLAEMHGMICSVFARNRVPMIKVSPTQMKLFMTGKGNADKRGMIKAVWNQYQVSMPDEHQYDALCAVHIGRFFILYCKDPRHDHFKNNTYRERVCYNLYMDKRFEGVGEKVVELIRLKSEVTDQAK